MLAISHDTKKIMETIGKLFEIKNDEYGPPRTYLGGELQQFTISDSNNERPWSLISTKYVKVAVANVETMLKEEGCEFKTTSDGKASMCKPIPTGYKPELDTAEECNAEHHSRFQQLIGILRWALEFGRIDIHIEVAIISQYSANPRVGHLEAVYCIFHYLKRNQVKRLVMDPETPANDRNGFNGTADWAESYGDVVDEDPPSMSKPPRKLVEIFPFCDSDHASNVVMRRSHSGILLFEPNALICSFSKKQTTVEASTYGAKLVAMRIARDMIVELRLKLKSIGVPMVGPANLFCNNQGVLVMNTSIPKSLLSKKHNSVNYHIVHEAAAAGILRIAKEDT
ncbi:hypothetical protein ACHAWF_001690, partial [Thalassiosira exigua]